MKKSKKICFIILSCFVGVFSFLLPIFKNDDSLQVKADSVSFSSSFISSNICLSDIGSNSSATDANLKFNMLNYYNFQYMGAFWYSFKIDISDLRDDHFAGNTDYSVAFSLKAQTRIGKLYSAGSSSSSDIYYPIITFFMSSSSDVSWNSINYFRFSRSEVSNYFTRIIALYEPSNFFPSGIMSKVEFGNYTSSNKPSNSWANALINGGYYNFIRYTDTSDCVYTFIIPTYFDSSNSYSSRPYNYLSDSTYYFITPSEDMTNNEYYNTGYDNGYQVGYSNGEQIGYGDGYSAGNTVGYNNGYNVGLNDSNQYTFFGLISAVVDAPLKAFYGLFNFELMGVNLAGFISAMLTLAIIIFIIRFALQK